ITQDVDQGYLEYLDSLRNDDAKAQLQNTSSLELHNER
ncbi:MAG: amidophosphoribosyltransferase, partial [Plesiomonas shigelloides]